MAGPTAGTATILFTDLVGSTELRSALGDAVADELQRSHERLAMTTVEEHHGTVVKTLGDGILASFNGAADAVAAAIAVQQRTDSANRRVEDARHLQVRVGASSGDVSWEEGDCHGTPVVVASRLCDRASGGQILTDDLVRGLARGRSGASFRMVGELELKGLSEPVVAYEVPWSPIAAGAAPLPAALLPVPDELPFAGREEERRALLEQWKSAQSDGRTVALLSGEPGVGKTRLTSEVARTAHEEGAWVLAGRCDESVAAPYTPWLEILRHAVAHAPADLLTAHVERRGGDLTRLVPELRRRVDGVPPLRELDPETERLALFDAVVDLIDALAADAPALVVIDDSHWADATSLDLLRRVVRQLPTTARVLVLVTYRDTDVDRTHPLAGVIADLRREPRVERIALRGMDENDIRALLVRAGGTKLDEEGLAFAHTLAMETEGNPFFISEIIQHLLEVGLLIHRDGRWQGTARVGEIGIPEGIRDVVGRRLTRLSEDSNETLRAAAVVGREFDIALVAAVTEQAEDAALALVEEALRARLVDEVPDRPGRMSFSHALVRSTLLEELSTTRRVRLHRRIGEQLERDPDAPAAELAYHFTEAAASGAADRAVEYAVRAAEEARMRVAYEEALRFYDLAFEALDAGDLGPRARGDLLCGRAYVHALRGDAEAGHRDGLAAAEIARELDDAALLARAGIAYNGVFTHWAQPSDPVAVQLMRDGLAGLDPNDDATRAEVTSMLASALIVAVGDEALELAPQAEKLAREVGDEESRIRALNSWAWALRGRGRGVEMCEVATAGIDLAQRTNNVTYQMAMRYLNGVSLITLGRIDEARAEFEIGSSQPTAISNWLLPVLDATLAIAAGRLDEAEAFANRAHDEGGALGATNDTIWCGQRTHIARNRGELDEALDWVRRSFETAFPVAYYEPVLLAEQGDLDGARRAVARYEQELAPILPVVVKYVGLGTLAEACLLLQDKGLARRLGEQLAPFEDSILGGDTFMDGAVEHSLGLVALVEGRIDDAVQLLGTALEIDQALGFDALVVRDQRNLDRTAELLA